MSQRRPRHSLSRPIAGALAVLVLAAATVVGAALPAQAAPAVPSALTFTEGVDPGVPTVLVETGTTTNSALYAETAPPGMVLEFSGEGSGIRLAGTPTQAGVYPVRFDVTFPDGPWMAAYTTVVTVLPATAAPVWSTTSLGQVTYLDTIGVELAASDTTSFAITAGSLPAGLSLTGANISGTVTAAPDVYAFEVTATGPGGSTAQPFSGSVDPRVISWPEPVIGPFTVGVAVSQQFSATNTDFYAPSAGALPPGLSLTADGLLSGTPTTPGSFFWKITARNEGAPVSHEFTIVVNDEPLVWQTSSLKDAGVGLAYSANLVATGAESYAVTGGLLPSGLTLSSAGVLSGTPTTAGFSPFTVTASKAGGASVAKSFVLDVLAAPVWLGETSVVVTVGRTKTVAGHFENILTIHISEDPNGPFSSASSGRSIAVTGIRPGTGATFPLGITTVHPSLGVRIDVTVLAEPVWVTSELPDVGQGAAVDLQLEATDATGYALTSGTLPPGLTLAADGSITGTPTAAGPYAFMVGATNGDVTVDREFTLEVVAPATWVGPTSLLLTVGDEITLDSSDTIVGGRFYKASFDTEGGFTASLRSVDLLAIDGQKAGTATLYVDIENALGVRTLVEIVVEVRNTPVWVSESLGLLRQGDAVDPALALVATDATGYALTAGALPDGLSLAADGTISGTPTAMGAYAFTVEATNGDVVVARDFAGDVNAPLAVWSTTSLEPLHVNVAASVALAAEHAVSFAVTDGSLPDGLALAADGLISGTPTLAGTFEVEVTATNATDEGVARSFTIVVDEPVITISLDAEPGDAASGVDVTVTGSGLAPDEAFDVTLFSDPIVVSSGVVAADGTIDVAASLPEVVPFGAHELRVTAVGADGEPFTSSVWFSVGEGGEIVEISTDGPVAEPTRTPVEPVDPDPTAPDPAAPDPAPAAVTAPSGIAATGVESSPWAVAAGLLLVLGAGLAFARRRAAASVTR
ncbi:Ig domain-containing protein [Agromyces salentinus]|uniref:Uncharacterized protein n=1 Tax=Agromyces salentinus TaxID=269421 RepID=A0ABN2MK16_9MICO|nr:Ig domain-containing protein [Agromyces salentinus]